MNQSLAVGLMVSVLALSACSSTAVRQPTRAERQQELARIQTQLALEYMKIGDFRQAVAAIDKAVVSDAKQENAWLVKAFIHQDLKQFDEAERSFQTALKLKPNSAETNNNYGWFLCSSQNQPQTALAYFDKALADPTYPSPQIAYLNKGICSGKLKQYGLAQAYLERTLNLSPQLGQAWKELARVFWQTGEFAQAQQAWQRYADGLQQWSAEDLWLARQIAASNGQTALAQQYEVQLREQFPYSDELKNINTGQTR